MAKVKLEGGFEAELYESIDKNRGQGRGRKIEKPIEHYAPKLTLERPWTEGENAPARVRVELLVSDWPAVKAAVEEAIARLVVK